MKRLLILLLLLVACQEEVIEPELYEQTPVQIKEAPKVVQQPEPLVEVAQVWTPVQQTNTNTQLNKEIIQAESVLCDIEGKRIKFTFKNAGNRHWFLGNDFPLKPPKLTVQVRVLLNGVHANGPIKFGSGHQLFGPFETFPENCGGVERITVGERATCTVEIDPLRVEGDGRPNEITIDPPRTVDDTTFKFYC